jgi:hypothetical protein
MGLAEGILGLMRIGEWNGWRLAYDDWNIIHIWISMTILCVCGNDWSMIVAFLCLMSVSIFSALLFYMLAGNHIL